jgi:hypothetical protein
MTVSLPIADSPPHDEPTSVTTPSESRMPVTFESVPMDERWDAWRAKGRLADAAFAEKMRSVALMGVVVAGAVGVFWIGFD